MPLPSEFPVESEGSLDCPGVTGYTLVRLRLEAGTDGGGRLLCDTPVGTRELMAWDAGQASFSYSIDGATWSERWPMAAPPVLRRYAMSRADTHPLATAANTPLVRLVLRRGPVAEITWIERAGDPSLRDPTEEFGATPRIF